MSKKSLETLITIAAPLALAILELFHPHPHDLFQLDLRTWMFVHYMQLPLFALSAFAAVLLVRDVSGFAASIARIAMFVFAISYIAFDTAAGVVTGVLLQAAKASATPQSWQPAVTTVWMHPIIGGAGPAPLLAVVGSIAWFVGAIATGWIAWRRRGSWIAAILLVVSAVGLSIFKTHAWPGGPVTFGALSAAAAWLGIGNRESQ